jgi:hypothetical protein
MYHLSHGMFLDWVFQIFSFILLGVYFKISMQKDFHVVSFLALIAFSPYSVVLLHCKMAALLG